MIIRDIKIDWTREREYGIVEMRGDTDDKAREKI